MVSFLNSSYKFVARKSYLNQTIFEIEPITNYWYLEDSDRSHILQRSSIYRLYFYVKETMKMRFQSEANYYFKDNKRNKESWEDLAWKSKKMDERSFS